MAQSTYREYVQITGNESVMMAQSSSGHDDVSASTEELEEYKHASNVNVSDFVLVKLSILSNDYDTWKAQMLSHLDKLKIRDIVENRGDWLKSRSQDIAIKYDILLKGWILGSLDEELLRRHLDYSANVQSIWWTLEDEYCFRVGLEVTKSAGKLLSKDSKSFEGFIIRLIYRKEYGLALELYKLQLKCPEKPTDKVLMTLTRNFPSELSSWEALIYPSWKNAGQKLVNRSSLLFYSFGYMYARAEHTLWRMKRFKNNYYSWLLPEIVMLLLGEIPNSCTLSGMSVDSSLHFGASFTLLYVVFPPVDGFSNLAPIKDIEKRKKEYEVAKDFLKETVSYVDSCNLDKSRFYKSIALEAVRLDVYEVLRLIISHFKETIEYPNEKHNIIQLAILHRSEKVYNHIFYPLIKQKETHRELKDYFGNNLLHLVGRLAPSYVLSRTTGAALQIQQELQWYEEVKKFMEPMQLTDKNIDDETPDEVFSREHENLVKEGQKWMKATAESSSITAALIVTIVFAAAITVPGGSNQETGIPLFKKQIAFTVFAVSDAISLFSASTSLLVFLSILTTRFAEKDFLHSLPRRLLIALFLLILSTSSMMLAFSAILFLVFCDQRPWMLAPIGVFTCMPIAAIVYLQLPLVTLWCNNTGVATMPAKPGVKPQMW
ncbi:Ankyrin repeat-containing protein [Artemisia annua]|uniref:Ankyrin repeat-containing protein n=1 Tax=Artemisia annua TaxID=35608 RepID=A0A2U1N418_ARTAN|nr:Ankyrin repeat-containing protein [Artemisia annua]